MRIANGRFLASRLKYRFDSRRGQEIFIAYKPSKLAEGPSQSPIQRASAALSPGVKPEPEAVCFRRVLKLRMSGAVPSLPCMHCAVHSDTFAVTTDGSKCISCGSYLTVVTWAEMTPEFAVTL